MKLGELIASYRKKTGMSQRQFANTCRVSNGYISMLESGKNPRTNDPIVPNLSTLSKIASAMGITLQELSRMADDIPPLNDEAETENDLSALLSMGNVLPLPGYRKIPLIGNIACGEPILAEENVDEYVKCPDDVQADFCLRCKGDSMTGARIHDGDIVYIRIQPDVENGEIAAVLIDEEATLKRIYKDGDTVILQPENPAYRPKVYVREEINQIRILGKAVCFFSKVR